MEEDAARAAGIEPLFRAAWIALTVHLDLHAVGLTAAFTRALGDAGISCNVIAAAYHDHIFVPVDDAERAMDALRALQRDAGETLVSFRPFRNPEPKSMDMQDTTHADAHYATNEAARDKAAALRRMKWFATALLVAVGALFMLARSRHDAGAWAWVASFAEAAMVGALADWFAVVALFRHPLGVPIPHTAILPANKARVADNFAVFVRDRFLGTDALVARVNAFDPVSRLSVWLAELKNADLLGQKAVTAVGQLLSFVDDERVKNMLYEAIRRRADQFDLTGAACGVLSTLTADRRHQLLLDEGFKQATAWLDKPDVQEMLAARIVAVAGEEYPKLVGMLGFVGLNAEELGAKFAAGLVRGANQWLHEVSENPEHERRLAFDAAVARFVERLKSDATFKARIDEHKREWLGRPELREYVNGLWDEFAAWLDADLKRPDSALHAKVIEAASEFARALGGDAALRDSINEHMRDALKALAPELREGIAKHIAATVKQWDDATLVRDVELNIGRDLQFIRVNGTLVGGAVGLLIHAVIVYLG